MSRYACECLGIDGERRDHDAQAPFGIQRDPDIVP